jgi:predicted metalloprotease with PDZ domain
LLDEAEMWQKLYEGFKRGQNNRRPDLSLAELSSQMRENRSYMRVYWSGAWYFLNADVELRRRTDSAQSLDTALALLNACCADRAMSAREMAARLDQLTGQELFLPLFEEVAASQDIPAFDSLFAELGLRIENDRVILEEGPDGVSIRQGICRGRGQG